MKKKFFFAAVALVMSAATAVGYKAYDKGNMSEFMMANIEALTQEEDGPMGKCYNEEATCLKVCPSCGGQWEIPTLLGPVKSIHGKCTYDGCNYEF